MKVLAVLAGLACLELIAEYVVQRLIHYNTFLPRYYEALELLMIGWVYYLSFRKKGIRLVVVLLCAFFTIVWLIQVPHLYESHTVVGSTQILSRIVLVALSLVAFQSIGEVATNRLIEVPLFWVSLGVLLYSAGTLIVFGLGNEILKMGMSYFAAAWSLNWLLSIAANLFFAKAFLCRQEI